MSVRPAIRVSTAHLRGAYPWHASLPLPLVSVPVGIDRDTGGMVAYDPFVAYQNGLITDPVIAVLGNKGSGKSTLVKSLAIRLAAAGHKVRYIDPKGEIGPLCQFFDVPPVRPGNVVLNPLDAVADIAAKSDVAIAVVGAAMDRKLLPVEERAIAAAVALAAAQGPPNLEDVRSLLVEAKPVLDALPVEASAADIRDLTLVLDHVASSAAGRMFFGASTIDLDPQQPFLGFDVSGHSDQTLRIAMVAVATMVRELGRAASTTNVIVLDEGWRLGRDIGTARWLQEGTKMARRDGACYIMVFQHVSDLGSVGDDTDERTKLMMGVLSDAATRIIYRQPPEQLNTLETLLDLSEPEKQAIGRLRQGEALWRIAGEGAMSRSLVVQHVLTPTERPVIDTDEGMGGRR